MVSLKQKIVFKKTLENGGSVSKAAKGVYSDSMAKNPQKITCTKGWKELSEQYLPDEKLVKKHVELLEDIKSEIQVKALDMAYKIKGSYSPEKMEVDNADGKEFKIKFISE